LWSGRNIEPGISLLDGYCRITVFAKLTPNPTYMLTGRYFVGRISREGRVA